MNTQLQILRLQFAKSLLDFVNGKQDLPPSLPVKKRPYKRRAKKK